MSLAVRVFFASLLLTALTALLVSSQDVTQRAVNVDNLNVGDFYRPQASEVSGFPNATTRYVRSPCPALNTLANHGHIPRDGKNITRAMFKDAIMTVFSIDAAVATTLTTAIPEVVSLALLSTHNLIEHDGSLVHADSSYINDPAAIDVGLWRDLISRAKKGKLGVPQLAAARRNRLTRCNAKRTGCDFGARQRVLAFGEASLLLLSLGGKKGETISSSHAESFLVDERIPKGYTKPATPVTSAELAATSAKILALAENPYV